MLLPLLVAATLSVAATTTDLRALVVAVAGGQVQVDSLTDPRQDPHTAEVHPRELAVLGSADLLVRIGLDHEPWLARAVATVKLHARDLDLSKTVALLGTDTPRLRANRGPHVHAFGNTHYWLDPENARPITAAILDALAALAPADRAAFAANRARFLAALDAGLTRWTAALAPYAGTRLVVAHDTWAYFARRFHLRIAATVEEQPGVPPSPAYLGVLIERMRAARVPVIVGEPSSPVMLLRRIGEATGARVVVLAPSVRALPEAHDYLALFDVDVARLAGALAGR